MGPGQIRQGMFLKGWFAGKHLVECCAEAINIACSTVPMGGGDCFRRDIIKRALDAPIASRPRFLKVASKAKINQGYVAVRCEKDIFRFNVSVHPVLAMEGRQTLGNLPCDPERSCHIKFFHTVEKRAECCTCEIGCDKKIGRLS